jgi:hypothetical protein
MMYRITYMINTGVGDDKKHWAYKHSAVVDANSKDECESIAQDMMSTMNSRNKKIEIDCYLIKKEA